MIEIFTGEDTQSSRKALQKSIENALLATGATATQRFSDVGFNPEIAREAIFAQNIFGARNIVIFDGILDIRDNENFYTLDIATTPNDIFIRETAPNKDILAIFKKIGKVKDFSPIKKINKSNNFALADAVAERDKKAAWTLYVKAIKMGTAPEELHGLIFWATKQLYLTANYSKEEALLSGVSSYNYQHYLTSSKKYLGSEIADRLRVLRNMYHDAHKGDGDFDALLEQYILKI